MAIPELDVYGLLPIGLHDCSVAEIEEMFGRFQRSDKRGKLFGRLREFLDAVWKVDDGIIVIVDGSFIMRSVDEPGDVDVILVFPPAWNLSADLPPFQYNVVSKRMVRKLFGFDMVACVAGEKAESDAIAFFTQVNVKWYDLLKIPVGDAEGIDTGALMIANDEQLTVVKEQIQRLESALESLAKTVRPKSELQYRIFAEGYVDQLAVLRNDVNEYLGLLPVMYPDADIEVSVEGPNAALGDTRVSAVTKLVDRFRRALRTTVGSIRDSMAPVDRENATDGFLDRLCDPRLQGVAPGSVKVQLSSPHVAVGNDLYAAGLELLSLAIRSAAGDADATAKLRVMPVDRQKAALTAAKTLAPEKDDLVEKVGLGGRFIGRERHVQFDHMTRLRLNRRLSRIARQAETRKVQGVIREVDLDRRLFSLREPETGLTIESCKYGRIHDATVKALLDDRVEVTGVRRSNALRATRLRVKTITSIAEGE